MTEILFTPIVVIHVIACLFLILAVLLQPGKSGGMGALTGAGATQVFGGRGAGNMLTRTTWITASTFFVTSVVLAFLSSSGDAALERRSEEIGVIEEAPTRSPLRPSPLPAEPTAPAPEDEASEDREASDATTPEGALEQAASAAAESLTLPAPGPIAPTPVVPAAPPAPQPTPPAMSPAPRPAPPAASPTPRPAPPAAAPVAPARPAPASPPASDPYAP